MTDINNVLHDETLQSEYDDETDEILMPKQPNILDTTSDMFYLDNDIESDANKMFNHLDMFLKEIEKIMERSVKLYDILPESRTQLTIKAKNKQTNKIQEFKYLPMFTYEKKNGYVQLSWVSRDIMKIMWDFIMQNYFMSCPHFRIFYKKYKVVINEMFSHMNFTVDYIPFLPLFIGLFNRAFNVISICSNTDLTTQIAREQNNKSGANGMYWLVDFRILPGLYFDSYNLFSLTLR